jgi:hypothetical protein
MPRIGENTARPKTVRPTRPRSRPAAGVGDSGIHHATGRPFRSATLRCRRAPRAARTHTSPTTAASRPGAARAPSHQHAGSRAMEVYVPDRARSGHAGADRVDCPRWKEIETHERSAGWLQSPRWEGNRVSERRFRVRFRLVRGCTEHWQYERSSEQRCNRGRNRESRGPRVPSRQCPVGGAQSSSVAAIGDEG